MHEASIAAPLLAIVLQEFAKHPEAQSTSIATITVQCGLLMGIEPYTLQGCFSIMAEETPAKEAQLVLHTVPMQGTCLACQQHTSTTTRHFACPHCLSDQVQWQGGHELTVEAITVHS